MLREQNVDPKEFDEILQAACASSIPSASIRTSRSCAKLQTFVSEGLKRFEYALRRKVGDDTDRALVNGIGGSAARNSRQARRGILPVAVEG